MAIWFVSVVLDTVVDDDQAIMLAHHVGQTLSDQDTGLTTITAFFAAPSARQAVNDVLDKAEYLTTPEGFTAPVIAIDVKTEAARRAEIAAAAQKGLTGDSPVDD